MTNIRSCVLIVCLSTVACATAMMPRSGGRTPINSSSRCVLPVTSGSRCQSPLSPAGALSPVSPYSRSCLSIMPVVPAVRMTVLPVPIASKELKESREKIKRLLDQKCAEMQQAERARFMSGGDPLIDDFVKMTLLQIVALRAQLSSFFTN